MKTAFLFASALLLCGCAATRETRLTSEPSIERALDIVASSPEGGRLLKFLRDDPVRFEYANTPGNCYKFALKRGQIYLPPAYRGADMVLALAIVRAAHIYRLQKFSGMDERISEEEELGALLQSRVALEAGAASADFAKAGGAPEVRDDLCAYVLESSGYAMAQARRKALNPVPDPDCQRPLETMESRRVWLEKTRHAINEQTFYQLLYERDLAAVKKGSLTMAEAMKRDADLRALPTYEVYRFQRTFYDRQSDIFSKFARLYSSEITADAAWRAAHAAEIEKARTEFSDCNLP